MRYLIPFLLLIPVSAQNLERNEVKVVESTIKHLQPSVALQDKRDIAKAVVKYSRLYSLNWQLMVALLFQESSLRLNPQSCSLKHRCSDFGIAQINYPVWGKSLALDKFRLLGDVDYSVHNMALILVQLRSRYYKDKKWPTRYHSFSAKYRREYEARVEPKMRRIERYASMVKE